MSLRGVTHTSAHDSRGQIFVEIRILVESSGMSFFYLPNLMIYDDWERAPFPWGVLGSFEEKKDLISTVG